MFKRIFTALSVSLIAIQSIISLLLNPALPAFAQEEIQTSVESTSSPAPSEEPSPSATLEPTPETTPTITTQTEEISLGAVVLEDTSTSSLQLELGTNNEITSASLTTDKPDYAPTDTALIYGTGLSANTTYIIIVSSTDEPAVTHSENITTDENGSFVYAYQLDGISRPLYTVEVKDAAGNMVAQTSFTDPPPPPSAGIDNYSQCSNDDGDGYATGDTGCRWTNGNLQSNNSTYFEGDATVQRLFITHLVDGPHTVRIQYGTTKGGKHAYDFLTDDLFSENWVTGADLCEDLNNFDSCSSLTPAGLSPDIPNDPNAGGHDSAAAHFRIRNGDITGVGTPTLQSGSYAGDSETTILLNFEVDTSDCEDVDTVQGTDTCPVLITWGAHISNSVDWNPELTAISISGSPYHVAIDQLDGGSIGQRDNQMQAGAVFVPQEGNIIIDKVTDPSGDPQGFTFNPSWESPFGLTDAAAPHDSGPLVAGAYSVSETIPSGWDLTNTNCVSSIGDTETATSLELDPLETITCTFTNTKKGHIIVDKVTDPAADPQSFDFIAGGAGYSNFSLTDAAAPNNQEVVPGAYSVSETVPAGWDLTSATCDQGETPANLDVGPGETVTCTFNNQKDANIIVVKQTDPDGDPTSFEFDPSYAANFFLTDGNSNNSGDLDPGTYSVSEDVPASWDLTSATCTDGTPTSISLQAGETITCTFTNTKRAHVIIVKDVIGNPDPTDFTFNDNFENGNPATFMLDEDNNGDLPSSRDFEVLPGTYSVSENPVDNWQSPESTSCTDGSPVNAIVVAPGETVTCTFVNEELVKIILIKNTIGGDGDFDFDGTGVGLPTDIDLTTVGGTVSQTFIGLDQDNQYSISETVPAGWDLTSATCDKGETVDDIDIEPGETVTCTFVNTKRGHIIVDKVTDPAADPQSFDFSLTGGPDSINQVFELTDVATPHDSGAVKPGTYNASETIPDGWDLKSATCSDDSDPSAINLSAGEIVTCTFTNEKDAFIIVEKQTIPDGSSRSFEFDPSYAINFNLTDGAQNNSGDLDPGTYSVDEVNIPAGWALTDTTCTSSLGGDENAASIGLTAGETVTCVFTDNQPGAQIDLDPLTATNKIGEDHVITATVQVHNGDGVYGSAVDGTLVTFSLLNNTASAGFVGGDNDCTTTAGSCSVTINSSNTGSVDIHAEASPEILGLNIDIETDSGGLNSDNANKAYVNAKISINPEEDTNEVNDDHDFIVTVEQDTGSGFTPVPEGTLANAIASPVPDGGLDVSDCNDGVDALGQCAVTINSTVAGIFTITARSTVVVSGVTFKLQTNGVGENSEPAVKTYVDASIALSPQEATNDVNEEHEITGTVTQNDGGGSDPAVGVTVVFSITSGTAAFVGGDNDCVTDGSGVCSVQIVDDTPGANTIDATTTFSVGGVSLTRATNGDFGPDGTDSAEKTYIAGRIIVQKVTVGGDAGFNFNADYKTDFQLGNGDSDDSGYIPTGAHSVSEDVLAGWDLTSATCTGDDDGTDPANIILDDGETVTCVFTNTKQAKLTIVKNAAPNDCQDFTFAMTNQNNFILDDNTGVVGCLDTDQDQSKAFENLAPNQDYEVTETLPNAFWEFGGVSCMNADLSIHAITPTTNGGTITLEPGADVTCTFVNNKLGPTRTLGFWKTHTTYTSGIFNGLGGSIQLGSGTNQETIDSTAKLFGAWYSTISQKSTGKGKAAQRLPVDQARMQLAWQWLAAKLNCAAFGCPSTILTLLANASSAYASGNITGMLNYAGQLDAYNNSGDTIIIGSAGKATPKTSQGLADLSFWDNP